MSLRTNYAHYSPGKTIEVPEDQVRQDGSNAAGDVRGRQRSQTPEMRRGPGTPEIAGASASQRAHARDTQLHVQAPLNDARFKGPTASLVFDKLLSSDCLGPASPATDAGAPPDVLAMGEDLAMDETTAGSARVCARKISDTTGNSCIELSSDESSGESAHNTGMTLPTDAAPATGAWGGVGRWRASPPVGPCRSRLSPASHTMRGLRLQDGREGKDRNAERNLNRQKMVKKADQAPLQKESSEKVGTQAHTAGAVSMPPEEPGDHEQRADKRPFTIFDHSPELAAYGGASKCRPAVKRWSETEGNAAKEGSHGAKEKAPRSHGPRRALVARGHERAKEKLPWNEKLKKMGLEEHYTPGRGRRNVSLYHVSKFGKKPRSVTPDSHKEQWWRMHQPRSGREFYLPDDPRSGPYNWKLPIGGARRYESPAMVPELCDFRVGDKCIAAADCGWWDSTVLEVEDKRVYVQIRVDNTRWIEYTAPKYLPAKPRFGHRLLSRTVHLSLPAPWTGKFLINVFSTLGRRWKEAGCGKPKKGTEINNAPLAAALQQRVEFSEKELGRFGAIELSDDSYIKVGNKYFKPDADATRELKGDWEFRNTASDNPDDQDAPSPSPPLVTVRNKARPNAQDLGFFSQDVMEEVKAAIETAVEKAKRMHPFLTTENHSSDLCDPALLDENYGGESCWRCGEGGELAKVSV